MKAIQHTSYQNGIDVEPTTVAEERDEVADEGSLVSGQPGDDWAEILHGLNNVLAGTLLNAQVMEWKLPSYSRSKRYLHEIERNAQRGGELVKRLLVRLQSGGGPGLSSNRNCSEAQTCGQGGIAVVPHDPGIGSQAADGSVNHMVHPDTVLGSHRRKAPHTMV